MPEVIVDTSAIQYLYQLGQLELLPKLYGHVTVPKSVADEIAAGLAHGISLPQINSLDWLIVQHARHEGLLVISADLGSGISPEMAIRLEKAFGGTAEIWLALQTAYDLSQARRKQPAVMVKRYTAKKA